VGHRQFMQKLCTLAHVENPSPEPTFMQSAANGRFGVGFSDATRDVLCSADRCLASEKRSSGKSRGWAWWIVCCYGDLSGAFVLAPV